MALSWCWKTQSVPRPELILDRNLSCFCGFSYVFFLVLVVIQASMKNRNLLERSPASGSIGLPSRCAFLKRMRIAGDPSPIRRCFRAVSARGKNWDSDCCVKSSARRAGSYWRSYWRWSKYYICPLWNSAFLLISSMLLLLLDEIKQKFHQKFLPKTLLKHILTHCDTLPSPPWRPAPDVAASLRRLWPQQWSWSSRRSWQKVWSPRWNIGATSAGMGWDGWHLGCFGANEGIVLSYKKIVFFFVCMVFLGNNMICQGICSANHHWQPIIHQPVIHQISYGGFLKWG